MTKKARQREFAFGHGGRREGAGRPKKKDAVVHSLRPNVTSHRPLHITIRVRKGLPSLRSKDIFKDFTAAIRRARSRGLHIVHFSLLSNHIHMIIEASNKKELEGGMKSFLISFAWKLKARGVRHVLENRYHLTVLKNPTQTRNALRYVLLNEEKHRGFKLSEIRNLVLSPFRTCFLFTEWGDLLKTRLSIPDGVRGPEAHEFKQLICPPRGWLLREGWKRTS